MRKLYLLAFVLCVRVGTVQSQDFTDFSGSWKGTCTLNGTIRDSTKEIKQKGRETITMDGTEFFLLRPTVTTLEDVDGGARYKEITAYDFHWDEKQKSIVTSARWLGWYVEKPGTWSGEGKGYIRKEGEVLVYFRAFEGKEELCRYSKK